MTSCLPPNWFLLDGVFLLDRIHCETGRMVQKQHAFLQGAIWQWVGWPVAPWKYPLFMCGI